MQPQSPNPDFDFMLKNQPPARRRLPLPHLSRPLKVAGVVIIAILLIIIVNSVLSGRKNANFQPIVGVLARNQEIVRVTGLTQTQLPLQDPQTQGLAATTYSALSSDKQQLGGYLAKNHVKVSAVQLAADTDKTTDTNLQSALQNNNLDATYVNYLKQNLSLYANDLQAAYQSAGPNGKKILKAALDSTNTLLASPALKS